MHTHLYMTKDTFISTLLSLVQKRDTLRKFTQTNIRLMQIL